MHANTKSNSPKFSLSAAAHSGVTDGCQLSRRVVQMVLNLWAIVQSKFSLKAKILRRILGARLIFFLLYNNTSNKEGGSSGNASANGQ